MARLTTSTNSTRPSGQADSSSYSLASHFKFDRHDGGCLGCPVTDTVLQGSWRCPRQSTRAVIVNLLVIPNRGWTALGRLIGCWMVASTHSFAAVVWRISCFLLHDCVISFQQWRRTFRFSCQSRFGWIGQTNYDGHHKHVDTMHNKRESSCSHGTVSLWL